MEAESFGQSALKLCAVAARTLGWRPADFWDSTPAELACVLAPAGQAPSALSRPELETMMEQDNV